MPAPDAELAALWSAVFGQPPPITSDSKMLFEILFRYGPPPAPYGVQPPDEKAGDAGDGASPKQT
jgi:hypothetical protein